MTHPLDRATALEPLAEGRWRGATIPEYMNMVGPYGGVTLASLLNAVLLDARRTDPPISISANFCSAIKPGAFEIAVVLERSGKYLQHWTVRQTQGDTVCSTATVVTGRRTETFSHQSKPMPDAPPPEEVPLAEVPRAMPFLQNLEFRMIEGVPRIESPHPEPQSPYALFWMRDAGTRPMDWLSLASLSDGFPPRLLSVRGGFSPMGTVSLSTYFLCTEDELAAQGDAPILGEADSNRTHAHFWDQHAAFWGRDGRLLASAAQVAWFKA